MQDIIPCFEKKCKNRVPLFRQSGCDCEEVLQLIAEGKIDTEPLLTHTYPLERIEEAYAVFENRRDGVIKIAIEC